MDDWRGTNDETHLLGTNVPIDASMLGSALKITSLGWKTSTAPTFPQRGHWNSVLCSRLNLDTYHAFTVRTHVAWLPFQGALARAMPVRIMPIQVVWRSNALLSHPSLVAQWLEHLHGKRKVLGSIPGLGKHFSPKYDCSLHQDQSLKSSWMIGEELTTKHTCLVQMSWSMHQCSAPPWRSPA